MSYTINFDKTDKVEAKTITLHMDSAKRVWMEGDKVLTTYSKCDNKFNLIDCELCFILLSEERSTINLLEKPYYGFYLSAIPFDLANEILDTPLPEDFDELWAYNPTYDGYRPTKKAKTYFDIFSYFGEHNGILFLDCNNLIEASNNIKSKMVQPPDQIPIVGNPDWIKSHKEWLERDAINRKILSELGRTFYGYNKSYYGTKYALRFEEIDPSFIKGENRLRLQYLFSR